MHIPSANRSIIASLKTISADGSFEQKQQLRCDEAPVFSPIAVIDVIARKHHSPGRCHDDVATVFASFFSLIQTPSQKMHERRKRSLMVFPYPTGIAGNYFVDGRVPRPTVL